MTQTNQQKVSKDSSKRASVGKETIEVSSLTHDVREFSRFSPREKDIVKALSGFKRFASMWNKRAASKPNFFALPHLPVSFNGAITSDYMSFVEGVFNRATSIGKPVINEKGYYAEPPINTDFKELGSLMSEVPDHIGVPPPPVHLASPMTREDELRLANLNCIVYERFTDSSYRHDRKGTTSGPDATRDVKSKMKITSDILSGGMSRLKLVATSTFADLMRIGVFFMGFIQYRVQPESVDKKRMIWEYIPGSNPLLTRIESGKRGDGFFGAPRYRLIYAINASVNWYLSYILGPYMTAFFFIYESTYKMRGKDDLETFADGGFCVSMDISNFDAHNPIELLEFNVNQLSNHFPNEVAVLGKRLLHCPVMCPPSSIDSPGLLIGRLDAVDNSANYGLGSGVSLNVPFGRTLGTFNVIHTLSLAFPEEDFLSITGQKNLLLGLNPRVRFKNSTDDTVIRFETQADRDIYKDVIANNPLSSKFFVTEVEDGVTYLGHILYGESGKASMSPRGYPQNAIVRERDFSAGSYPFLGWLQREETYKVGSHPVISELSDAIKLEYSRVTSLDLPSIMEHHAARDRAALLLKAPYLSMILSDPMIQRFILEPESFKWHSGVIVTIESFLRSPDPQLRKAAEELLDESSYSVPFNKVRAAFPPCFPTSKFIDLNSLLISGALNARN